MSISNGQKRLYKEDYLVFILVVVISAIIIRGSSHIFLHEYNDTTATTEQLISLHEGFEAISTDTTICDITNEAISMFDLPRITQSDKLLLVYDPTIYDGCCIIHNNDNTDMVPLINNPVIKTTVYRIDWLSLFDYVLSKPEEQLLLWSIDYSENSNRITEANDIPEKLCFTYVRYVREDFKFRKDEIRLLNALHNYTYNHGYYIYTSDEDEDELVITLSGKGFYNVDYNERSLIDICSFIIKNYGKYVTYTNMYNTDPEISSDDIRVSIHATGLTDDYETNSIYLLLDSVLNRIT